MKYKDIHEGKKPNPFARDYEDSPDGAKELITAARGRHHPRDGVDHDAPVEKHDAGHYVVTMKDGKKVSAYVGGHSLAPDFEEHD